MNPLFGLLLAALFREAGAATCYNGTDLPFCNDDPCSGVCEGANGCLCTASPFTACVPRGPDICDPSFVRCCPAGYSWNTESLCCTSEAICYPACLSDEYCAFKDGLATCHCNTTVYKHANRSDLVGSVDCQASAIAVYLSKCLLEKFHYDYYKFTFIDTNDTCAIRFLDIVNNQHVVGFQLLPISGDCGTILSANGDKVTYSNVLYIPPDYSNNVIISNALNLSFSCTYNKTMQTSLLTALHPIIGTVQLPDVTGNGSATASMAAYRSNTFTDPIETSTNVIVGEPLYIGILTSFTDSTFVLRAERCVASPTNTSTDAVELIANGCILNEDVNTEWISNGESLEVRFRADTFVFKDSPTVYISCDVRLCNKASGNCAACSSGRSQSEASAKIILGPIQLSESLDVSSGSHTAVSWAVLWSSLLALLSLKMM